MTVHEAKLIQTFPPDYVISGSWGEAMRQIGNAVPVLLAEKMGRSVLRALGEMKPVAMTYHPRKPRMEQLRLAIEKRNKNYQGRAAGKTKSAKLSAKPSKRKTAVKPQKSMKAKYSKHG